MMNLVKLNQKYQVYLNNMKKFSQINEARKLSGKEIEIGKPYDEWTEAEKLQSIIDLAVDGFHLHLGHDKLQSMTKEQIIDKCDNFYDWMKTNMKS